MKTLDAILDVAIELLCWAAILIGIFTREPWPFAGGATILALRHLRKIESRL